jgi:hypothetical protein
MRGMGSEEWRVESEKSNVESGEYRSNFPLSTFDFSLLTPLSLLPTQSNPATIFSKIAQEFSHFSGYSSPAIT